MILHVNYIPIEKKRERGRGPFCSGEKHSNKPSAIFLTSFQGIHLYPQFTKSPAPTPEFLAVIHKPSLSTGGWQEWKVDPAHPPARPWDQASG